MPGRRIIATSLIVMLLCAPCAFAAQGSPIASSICVAPGVNPRVMTNLSATLNSPRVYFRAQNGPEYYVDMQRGVGDQWWAVLPAVNPTTPGIVYRVAALDPAGHWINGAALSINTIPSCPVTAMTPTDIVAADNIALGLTSNDESATPVGFSCRGVKNVIDANGQMRRADECRMVLARFGTGGVTAAGTSGTGAAAGTVAAEGGLSAATIAALAIGGAVAGYAIYKNHNNNHAVSPSRP